MIGEMEQRPPYVRFEQRAVEDRAKSNETGVYSYKDVNFALVTPHGSKDVFEDEAESWLAKQQEHARKGRIPETHFKYFKSQYDAWKDGQELPEEGTPIKGWAVLSPAQQQMCIQANVRTVEDLALAPEDALHQIGMGARALKQKAVAWLSSADTGKSASQIVDLQNNVQYLTEQNEKLQKQLEQFMADSDKEKQPAKPKK